jgi:hypothetical protein
LLVVSLSFSFSQKASKAQAEFLKSYPEMAQQLAQIARGMMA